MSDLNFPFVTSHIPVTILDGDTDSDSANLTTGSLCALRIPDNFTGTSISFLVSSDNGENDAFEAVYDETGSLYELTVVEGTATKVSLTPGVFAAYQYIKIVANAQDEDVEIILYVRPI